MTMTAPKNKSTRALELIKAGGATVESLMAELEVNKAGLASQLSYLNTRGLNIAEVDPTRAEFPMKDENGFFYMAGFDAYEAKMINRQTGGSTLSKPKTMAEVLESAQKREDKASKALSFAQVKFDANPNDDIFGRVVKIRELELELASIKLHHVEQGNFEYEHATIVDDAVTTTPPAKKIREKKQNSDYIATTAASIDVL